MTKAILKSAALIGALAFASGAYASPVELNYNGQPLDSVSASISYPGGSSSTSAGAFQMQETGSVETFLAFCADVFDTLTTPAKYNIGPLSGLSGDNTVLSRVQKLFDHAYEDAINNSATAAFQLALWEIITEDPSNGNGLDLGDGDFKATSSANSAAQILLDWVADGNNTVAQKYNVFFAAADPAKSSQNLVFAEKLPPVPVPAAGLLLLAGLAGLGAMARRRKEA